MSISQCNCGDIVGQCGCMRREMEALEARNAELESKIVESGVCESLHKLNIEKLQKKLEIAVKLLTSLRSLIELSIDSENNYESWLSRNKEALSKIKSEGL